MPKLTSANPKYSKHKASGQAIVSIDGHTYYLGPFGTKASKAEYDRLVMLWLGNGRQMPRPDADVTVVEMLAAFRRHAVKHYRKNGKGTRTLDNIDDAIRLLKQHYGREPVREFGPLKLKAIQQLMIRGYSTGKRGREVTGLARKTINKRIGIIKQIFAWAVSEEMAPPSLAHALRAVRGLQAGRSDARETGPVLPVSMEMVNATLPYLPVVVADMVQLQLATGCRPSELCMIRPADVDRSGDVWVYTPSSHKTEHHGRERSIYIGPKAQAILRPYLLRPSDSHCFAPTDSEKARRAAQHAKRKTPISCGNRPGSNRARRPQREPRQFYDRNTYARAVLRACDAADTAAHETDPQAAADQRIVERWSPNRLRHTAATEIRKRFGLEAAQVILGHSRADITQVYAERDKSLGLQVVKQIG